MTNLTLITGGVKSGKSRLGSELLEQRTTTPLLIATASRTDAELSARIDRHISERNSHWQCIEAPLTLPLTLMENDRPLLVDCLGTWLTNLLVEQPETLESEVKALLGALESRQSATILISNECGLGVIGADALTRRFVDQQGLLNQAIASIADQVCFCVAGIPSWIKGTKPEAL